MKYAIIYQSKSGNVKEMADAIFYSLKDEEAVMVDIDETDDIPDADFYFIGFAVRNNNCGMDIVNLFENLTNIKYALFISCGFLPTEKYKENILNNLDVWLPENSTLVDSFFCQGRVEKHEQEIMIAKMPHSEPQLREMFGEGNSHPDEDDLLDIELYSLHVINDLM